MVTLLTIIHVLCALVLILVVLLQSARGTDLAGAFGGMGSQTAFGPRGTSNFLSRTTAVLAAVFMVTSLSLAVLSNRGRSGGSVLSGEKAVPVSKQKAPPAGQPQTTVIPITPQAPTAAPGSQGLPSGIKQTVEQIPATPKPSGPSGAAPAGSQQAVPPAQPPAASAPAPANPQQGAAPAAPSGQ